MSNTDDKELSDNVIGKIFLKKVIEYGEGKGIDMKNADLIRDIIGYNPKTGNTDMIDSSVDIISHINQELKEYCSNVGNEVIKPTYKSNTPVILTEAVQQTPTSSSSPNQSPSIESPSEPVELTSALDSQVQQVPAGTDTGGSDSQAPSADQNPQVDPPSAPLPLSAPPSPPVQQISNQGDMTKEKLLRLSFADMVKEFLANGGTKGELKTILEEEGVEARESEIFKNQFVDKILEKQREKTGQSPAVNPGGGGIKRKKYSKRRRKSSKRKKSNKKKSKRKYKRKYSKRVR